MKYGNLTHRVKHSGIAAEEMVVFPQQILITLMVAMHFSST